MNSTAFVSMNCVHRSLLKKVGVDDYWYEIEEILGFTRRLLDEGSDEKLKKLLSTNLSDADIVS